MRRLRLVPEASGFTAEIGETAEGTSLAAPVMRLREGLERDPSRIKAAWICEPAELDYLQAFHRTATKRGALPFTLYLILTTADAVLYRCMIVPKTWQLDVVGELTHRVSCQLDVVREPT